jgi:hypothetical protein
LGGVDFHSASGGVAAEFTILSGWVPEVIDISSVVRCGPGVVIHGMWVEFGVGVGASHVSGFGGPGDFGGNLLGLCGIDAEELAFAGE